MKKRSVPYHHENTGLKGISQVVFDHQLQLTHHCFLCATVWEHNVSCAPAVLFHFVSSLCSNAANWTRWSKDKLWKVEMLLGFSCSPPRAVSSESSPLSCIGKYGVLKGPLGGPCTRAKPRPPNADKKALALAERTEFGPLIASAGPTETLNIEQLFYLMRQNFMAASIQLCQPSVLWQQSLNFFFLSFTLFFCFPATHKLLRWIERGRFFPSRWRETSVADYVEKWGA